MLGNILGFLILAITSISYTILLISNNMKGYQLAVIVIISVMAAIGLYDHFSELVKISKEDG